MTRLTADQYATLLRDRQAAYVADHPHVPHVPPLLSAHERLAIATADAILGGESHG